jgi:Sodium/calcium exchanger protein
VTASIAGAAFLAGAVVSLATSWLLVSRLERVGERLGLSEALLGIVAALAADAPEVTAAVSAMASGEQRLGAGVVIGSNVLNLAALLGLGAVVAGRIALHRKVVLLGGTVAVAVAGVCRAVVLGVVPPTAGCLLGLLVVALSARSSQTMWPIPGLRGTTTASVAESSAVSRSAEACEKPHIACGFRMDFWVSRPPTGLTTAPEPVCQHAGLDQAR